MGVRDMCKSDEYNGWANRETWAANLWLSNDQGFYEDIRSYIATAAEDRIDDEGLDREGLAAETAEYIENMLDELCNAAYYRDRFGSEQPDELASMASDIGSHWRIDYRSIAESWVNDWEEEQS